MKLVVSAQEQGLEAKTDGRFGRCRYFTLVDTETMECRSICNKASEAAEGAGVKAAELVLNEGAACGGTDGPPGIGCPVISSLSGADAALIIIEPTVSGIHDLERVLDCALFLT